MAVKKQLCDGKPTGRICARRRLLLYRQRILRHWRGEPVHSNELDVGVYVMHALINGSGAMENLGFMLRGGCVCHVSAFFFFPDGRGLYSEKQRYKMTVI
jgi:hypothetical protein